MDDLKSVTVGSLRELARKHLGSGYSKLNKEELIAALAGFVPSLARLARLVGIELPRKGPAAKKSSSGPARPVTPSARSKQVTRSAPKAAPSVKILARASKAKAEATVKGKAAAAKAKGAAKAGATPARAKAQGPVKVPATPSREKAPAKVAAAASKEKAPRDSPSKVVAAAAKALGKLPAKVAAAASRALGKLPGKVAAPPIAPLVEARTSLAPLATDTPRAKTPRKAATEMSEQGRVTAPKRVAAKRASEKSDSSPSARPAHIVNFPPKPRGSRDTVTSTEPEAVLGSNPDAARPFSPSASSTEAPPDEPVEQHPAEPLVEGFFVARVRGEAEARRHHLQQPPAPTPEASLLAAPEPEAQEPLSREYHDDTALLLPRDPHTLFALWDFSPATRSRAMQGLEEPRSVLRVFDGESLVREVDCSLESRSYYIHGLPPGRPYRVEAHFVGRDGKAHRIGPSSNRVALPPSGVSTDTSVRFLRRPVPVEPEAPVAVAPVPTLAPENHEREYITWHRVNLPGSAGVKDIPVVHREGVGPGAPPSPEGPGSQAGSGTYLQGIERAPGASDQRYLASHRYLDAQERAPGASDMRYGEGTVRPASSPRAFEYLELGQVRAPGSSEQRYSEGAAQASQKDARPPYQYLDIARAPGASDMRYAEPPPRSAGPMDAGGLEAPLRPTGTTGSTELHYFEAPARAPGASDMRYFESPPRAPGASDRRYSDLVGGSSPEPVTMGTGSSDQDSNRKPPSGGGRS
ncbi:DUF4912 domain-containing protein [Myxococcus sp. AM011]|uniref:DUF4912 domain-containing protein n=1 Tax=Myxococcus sp. AM011 TaxID=2745200 RepID=UPI0015950ED9|nr:DUF4912 domain-containing protein [Myxococcus sp. AM011]NVJ27099.1 DUF4912 domain-containing protein [Myxococcus sp. AM011]